MTGYGPRLRASIGNDPEAALLYLGNFEVERAWAGDNWTLPLLVSKASQRLVNRMEELCLLCAEPGDYVLLKDHPDPYYLDYLDSLGIGMPTIIALPRHDPDRNITADLLSGNAAQSLLRGIDASKRVVMTPVGTSGAEEKLSRLTGIPLAGPPSDVYRRVNSKVFSRTLNDELGIRQVPGLTCTSLEEFARARELALGWLQAGEAVVVKDAYGVSGKGLIVLTEARQFDRVERLIQRRAERQQEGRIGIVIEKWINKLYDVNYQLTISRDGRITFDFVKQAITANGVHKGHVIPAELKPGQVDTLQTAAELLGSALYANGYYGVVGVDALVACDGTVYPNLEVNARFNMSTYQWRVQELFLQTPWTALARYYPVRLRRQPISFKDCSAALGDLLIRRPGDRGILPTCFATVNAGLGTEESEVEGRLYGIVIGRSKEETFALDTAIDGIVKGLTGSR